MYRINDDLSIYATRGDVVTFTVTAKTNTGEQHIFSAGDTVRITITEKKNSRAVVLKKDFPVLEDTASVTVILTGEETKLGDLIDKPKDYWYEIELNPEHTPQTIIGYDDNGAKVFRLYPEGGDGY